MPTLSSTEAAVHQGADPLLEILKDKSKQGFRHEQMEPWSEQELDDCLRECGVEGDIQAYKKAMAKSMAEKIDALRVVLDEM